MDSDRAHDFLAAERERIEREIAELGPEAAADREEPDDRGSEDLYQQEFYVGRATELRDQLAAVERAEARLADGLRAVRGERRAHPGRASRGAADRQAHGRRSGTTGKRMEPP